MDQQSQQAKPLDIKVELDQLRKMYTADIAAMYNTFNALILGQQGTGKTHLLKTCRKPVIVHSFDPGGTKVLKAEVADGSVIPFWELEKEDMNSPTAYKRWEEEFFRLRERDVFKHIGTYCIDSFTTWFEALCNQIVKRKSSTTKSAMEYRGATIRETGLMELKDWQVAGNIVRDMTKLCTALPCDFLLTGHLMLVKEEVSGAMMAFFNSIPSLRVNIPILFDEIYVMEAKETSQGIERTLLTGPTGKYVAKTRMGSGMFGLREKPDIKALLVKAGMSSEDII